MIYKIDIEQQEQIARAFNIGSAPSFVFMPMGDKHFVKVGELSIEQMRVLIDKMIK